MRLAVHPMPQHNRMALRAIAVILALTLVGDSMAFARAPLAPLDPIQIKQALTKRGTGKGVKVKGTDGSSVSGTLVAIRDDAFDLAPKNATQPITIRYAEVSKVQNNGLSTGSKVAIGVLVGLTSAAVVVVFVAFHEFSKPCPSDKICLL